MRSSSKYSGSAQSIFKHSGMSKWMDRPLDRLQFLDGTYDPKSTVPNSSNSDNGGKTFAKAYLLSFFFFFTFSIPAQVLRVVDSHCPVLVRAWKISGQLLSSSAMVRKVTAIIIRTSLVFGWPP